MSKNTNEFIPPETVVEVGEYKGYPTFTIWELRPDGQKKDAPLIAFGTKKAKALVKHIEDIEAFTEGN